jgi:hypothetical protein
LYDVKFPNGMVRLYAANVIAENIYNMVNNDGKSEAIFDGIVGHRSNHNAVTKDNRHLTINDQLIMHVSFTRKIITD